MFLTPHADIRIDDEARLKTMRISLIQGLLKDRGWACRSCMERGDYLRFIREQLAAAAASARREEL